jgi:hypothetical protein
MKHATPHPRVLLAAAALAAAALAMTLTAGAQQRRVATADVAATFSFEHAQVAQTNGNRFWLKGGSFDAAVTFSHGFGLAANLTGEHTTNIQNGVGLGKIAFMAGPRYSFDAMRGKPHHPQLFAEWLFGGVHAFDSAFPGTSATSATASSFSTQAGGGVNVAFAKGLGIRLFEIDYVHTSLPNNAANSQNDLRLAAGATYRFGRR